LNGGLFAVRDSYACLTAGYWIPASAGMTRGERAGMTRGKSRNDEREEQE